MVYFVIICCVLVSIFIVDMLSVINNKLYCFFYEHEDWKLWENFIKDADRFQIDENRHKKLEECYKFFDTPYKDRSWGIHFTLDGRYKAIVSPNGLCSIFYNNDCLLCTFDRYHSRKMANILLKKLHF